MLAIARFTQRLRGYRAHFCAFKTRQTFTKTRQTIPAALHRLWRQVPLIRQPIALAHGFFEVFGAEILAVLDPADFEAKAVRSQVDSRQACSILHQ